MKKLMTFAFLASMTATATAGGVANELGKYAYSAKVIWKDPRMTMIVNDETGDACYREIKIAREEGIPGDELLPDEAFEGMPTAKHIGRPGWVIKLDDGVKICDAFAREATTSYARRDVGAFVVDLAQTDGMKITFNHTGAGEKLIARANQCDELAAKLGASPADKTRALGISVDGKNLTIASFKAGLCQPLRARGEEFVATYAKARAVEDERVRAEEERERKELAAYVASLKKRGIAGERLAFVVDYRGVLFLAGRRDASDSDVAKASVFFYSSQDEDFLHVHKVAFRGNKLASRTTKSYSRLLYSHQDSRLYR